MIEVKCPYYKPRDGRSRLHQKIPKHYYVQINALLTITDRQWCDYICWAPEGMVVYRVTRDDACLDFLLYYFAQIYAAMAAQADGPPPLLAHDKKAIDETILSSMAAKVDYSYWNGLHENFPPPSADAHDVDAHDVGGDIDYVHTDDLHVPTAILGHGASKRQRTDEYII